MCNDFFPPYNVASLMAVAILFSRVCSSFSITQAPTTATYYNISGTFLDNRNRWNIKWLCSIYWITLHLFLKWQNVINWRWPFHVNITCKTKKVNDYLFQENMYNFDAGILKFLIVLIIPHNINHIFTVICCICMSVMYFTSTLPNTQFPFCFTFILEITVSIVLNLSKYM